MYGIILFYLKHDYDLSLREKIKSYVDTQINIKILVQDKSEAQIFFISVFSWFSQVIDVLLVCTRLQINPYIRFNLTFHYLGLIMQTFSEDDTLRKMIEKTVVFYVFRQTINSNCFKDLAFLDYCTQIKNSKMLNNIIDKMNDAGIDIFKEGPKKVEAIIAEEFKMLLEL